MKKEFIFALESIQKNIRSSAELRTSFWMNIFGMALNNIAFILIWVFLTQTVGSIGGWTVYDVIGLQGFSSFVFGFSMSFNGGLHRTSLIVSSGTFDQFLTSPKNILVRLATSYLHVSAIGDMLFGAICIGIYLYMINAGFTQIILTLIILIFSILVFTGVTICIQAISFYFTDPDSVTRSIFELFFTPALFHGGAFQGPVRFIFIFIIPSLLIGALPVESITHLGYLKALLLVILSIAWFIFSIWLFNKSIKKYESSNFMTFGQ